MLTSDGQKNRQHQSMNLELLCNPAKTLNSLKIHSVYINKLCPTPNTTECYTWSARGGCPHLVASNYRRSRA